MKKLLISLLSILGFCCGGSAMAQKPFIIDGTVDNAPAGTEIILSKITGRIATRIASDTLQAARFHFEVPINGDSIYNYGILVTVNGTFDTLMGMDFKGQAGKRAIMKGKNLNTRAWIVESDVPGQHTMNLFTDNSRELLDSIQNLGRRENRPIVSERKLRPQERDSLRKLIRESRNRLYDSVISRDVELMSRIPVDEVWLDKFANAATMARHKRGTRVHDTLLALYNNLTPEQKLTPEAQEAEGFLFQETKVKPGDYAPEAEMPDLEGKMHRLSDLKGRYQLLDFGSSGCGACVYSMPELKEIASEYGDRLAMVSITIDSDKEIWRKASEQHGITWLNLRDPKGYGGLLNQYSERLAIPTFVLVGPDGKVLDIWIGYHNGVFKEKLNKFMK